MWLQAWPLAPRGDESARGSAGGLLQQLRHHRDRDHLRLLAGDARHAYGAGHALDRLGRDAARLEAVDEAGAFGLRADQAEEGEVAALEDGFADAHVQVVAVCQYQVVRIR